MRSARSAGPGFSPLDEELQLLAGGLSATVLEGLVRLATWMPFAQAAEHLAFFWQVSVEASTVRRQTEAAVQNCRLQLRPAVSRAETWRD